MLNLIAGLFGYLMNFICYFVMPKTNLIIFAEMTKLNLTRDKIGDIL